ncbi:MAG: ParB/RepB/Spo0J family partition protein [Planctomycetota bacterium]
MAQSGLHAELELVWLDLTEVSPNPHQPRTHFDDGKLDELAGSIRTHGVMQPVVVRLRSNDVGVQGGYELIAGERRWRAAQRAGIPALPAIIRDLDDESSAELALVENLQREDLNPIERAEALHVLHADFGLTHEQIGQKVGLKRSSVSNLLRLLELGSSLRTKVASGELTMGHARALLGASSMAIQDRAAALIDTLGGITVRQSEELIRYENALIGGEDQDIDIPVWHPDAQADGGVPRGTPASVTGQKAASGPGKSEWIQDLERQMSQALTTKVAIRPGRKNGSGQVTIQYHSLEDFDALLEKLGVKPE